MAPVTCLAMAWTTGTESARASRPEKGPSTRRNGVRSPAASQIAGLAGGLIGLFCTNSPGREAGGRRGRRQQGEPSRHARHQPERLLERAGDGFLNLPALDIGECRWRARGTQLPALGGRNDWIRSREAGLRKSPVERPIEV